MLQDKTSLFASTELHSREIDLFDGEKHTFLFRELTSAQFRKYVLIESSGSFDQKAENVADLISISLVDEDGSQALTKEQASKLKPKVSVAIYSHILDINMISAGKDEKGAKAPEGKR